jgi:hypothetical protein
MENYEKSVAMTPQQMRGVVIISLPRPDQDVGKTMCAAMWQQQQQQNQEHQQQVQDPPQQVQTPPPPSPPPYSRWERRPPSKWKRFRKRVIWPLVLLVFLFLGYKFPSLYYSEMALEEENEEKGVHVYTLHPKFTSVPIKLSVVRRNLLERDLKRLGKAAMAENSSNNRSAFFPVRGNIYPDGLYYIAMLIGSPSKLYYLDMDTGSDLTWLQCDAPCRSCAAGPHGLYDPKKGRLVDCRQPICAQVQQGGSYTCAGNVRQCDYDVDYADGSSTMGILIEDTLNLFLTNGTRTQMRAIIGCGYDQQGTLAQTPAATDGVMGLSSSKIALPSQMARKGIVTNVIGHCLAGGSNGGGYLFFGDALVPAFGVTWTPMMGRPVMEGYQARLRSIRYGAEELKLEDKAGDVGSAMFDSGTSFTYLVPEAYEAVLEAVKNQAENVSGLLRDTTDTTLPFCWRGTSPFESMADVHQYFKTVTLDFGGSSWFLASKTLELNPEGYLIVSTQGNVCLGILDASGASLEVTNIIGDISMRGYLILYDNVRERIGWVRRNCHNRPTKPTSQILSQIVHLFD